MASFPKSEVQDAIEEVIRGLPLLSGKSHLVKEAAMEICWATVVVTGRKSDKQHDNDVRNSVAQARDEIENLIVSIESFLSCTSNLGSVAVRSIDRQVTAEIIADDIGYVYLASAQMAMGALRDKARDALSQLPTQNRPKGRPLKNESVERVTEVAGRWYETMTGKKATRKHDPYTNETGSLFTAFLDELFVALDLTGSSDSLTRRSKEKKAKKKSD